MTKTPYKVRVGISVGLFIWSIGAIIASIYFSQSGLLWTAYVGPILAFIAFVLSVIIMPKTSNDNNSIKIEEKPTQHFISQPSWNYEDDEEDDEEEWDDEEEEEEEERRRQEEEEEEERRREEEDEEEFMMYYEDDD
ncbi:MAG: hypothetical protein GX638_18405 [Crenarchaeota archaeon]|nr:hypothetical protein [Thermoproteota archaeon]